MAYPQVGSAPAKLSFAKIAAMPAPNVTPAVPKINKETKPKPSTNGPQTNNSSVKQSNGSQIVALPEQFLSNKDVARDEVTQVSFGIGDLSLAQHDLHTAHEPLGTGTNDSPQDDQSQLSSSSFKQHSFETKSMASVTTFAMDEKESIRPDDSASVRAVDEDELHASLSTHSSFHHESDHYTGSQRAVVRPMSSNVVMAPRRYPGMTLINPPRFGDLPIDPVAEVKDHGTVPSESIADAPIIDVTELATMTTAPDEKLLEALSSPKDRLPLLQLEEKFMSFVSHTRDDVLELPPQNSFNRLLTHKLADYYNLAHQVTDDNSSVRIFRTRCCTLPLPLAEIAKAISVGPTQASNAAHVKIMRRAQLATRQFSAGNSTAASSSVPSKATSENGAETNSEEGLQSPSDGTPNRDKSKLTREEREAQYKAARERIFGDFQESVTSESGSTGETSASMSRSSSSSGKRKQRKHKAPKDDSFEARSAFIASYAPMQMQSAYQPTYSEMQFPGAYSAPINTYPQNLYGPPSPQTYPGFDPSTAYGGPLGPNGPNNSGYVGSEGWQNAQQSQSFNYNQSVPYQQPTPVHPHMGNHFPQTMQQPMSPGWMGTPSPGPFGPAHSNPVNGQWPPYTQPPTMQNGMPYQYGQLPPQGLSSVIPHGNQHPIPGSYSPVRSLFNPQTRSFVPNNNSGRTSGRGGRKKGGQTPNGARSGSTSGAGSPALPLTHSNASPKPKEDSLQQKYGTPANLPKKPPPSRIIPHFSGEATASSGQPIINPLSINVNGNGQTNA